jgi:hypothetical protein
MAFGKPVGPGGDAAPLFDPAVARLGAPLAAQLHIAIDAQNFRHFGLKVGVAGAPGNTGSCAA